MSLLEEIKYPIGKYIKPIINHEVLNNAIKEISYFPDKLSEEVKFLSDTKLDTPYREGGWTIRQVVHHCADSHMNSLVRLKLALTEDKPIIKPYFEERWAELFDSKKGDIVPALQMLRGIHERWVTLVSNLSESDLKRTFIHPEHQTEIRIDENIVFYAWHCNHHLAHITTLKKNKNWA